MFEQITSEVWKRPALKPGSKPPMLVSFFHELSVQVWTKQNGHPTNCSHATVAVMRFCTSLSLLSRAINLKRHQIYKQINQGGLRQDAHAQIESDNAMQKWIWASLMHLGWNVWNPSQKNRILLNRYSCKCIHRTCSLGKYHWANTYVQYMFIVKVILRQNYENSRSKWQMLSLELGSLYNKIFICILILGSWQQLLTQHPEISNLWVWKHLAFQCLQEVLQDVDWTQLLKHANVSHCCFLRTQHCSHQGGLQVHQSLQGKVNTSPKCCVVCCLEFHSSSGPIKMHNQSKSDPIGASANNFLRSVLAAWTSDMSSQPCKAAIAIRRHEKCHLDSSQASARPGSAFLATASSMAWRIETIPGSYLI